jgi:hypothetical protein
MDLAGMHAKPARKLSYSAVLPHRRQRHLRLELSAMLLPSIGHVSPGNETAQVIIRRLFDRVDPAVSAKVSTDHHGLYQRVAQGLYQRVAQDHHTLISEEARSPKYAERLRDCYPFHPRLMKTAEERLRMVWPRLSMARYRYTHRAFDRHVRLIHSP